MRIHIRIGRHSVVAKFIPMQLFCLEHAVEQPDGDWEVRRSLMI